MRFENNKYFHIKKVYFIIKKQFHQNWKSIQIFLFSKEKEKEILLLDPKNIFQFRQCYLVTVQITNSTWTNYSMTRYKFWTDQFRNCNFLQLKGHITVFPLLSLHLNKSPLKSLISLSLSLDLLLLSFPIRESETVSFGATEAALLFA